MSICLLLPPFLIIHRSAIKMLISAPAQKFIVAGTETPNKTKSNAKQNANPNIEKKKSIVRPSVILKKTR